MDMFVTRKINDYSDRCWSPVGLWKRGRPQQIWNEEITELKWKWGFSAADTENHERWKPGAFEEEEKKNKRKGNRVGGCELKSLVVGSCEHGRES
jgi:hypothetical protein